jgi:uncharacterized protein
MHYEIYSKTEGLIGAVQWRWRLVADNGKKLASGEGYYNKADCLHAIDLLKSTATSTPVREVAA